jgi:CRISPR type II-A-associated protein Csn2
MILHNEKWHSPIYIKEDEPTIIVFKETNELFYFQKELRNAIEGLDSKITIFDNDRPLKIDKEVEFIHDILSTSLNTRKSINYLHKNLSKEASRLDSVVIFEDLINNLKQYLLDVRQETLIDFTIDESIDNIDIFKLFKIQFSEREDRIIDLLVKYIDIIRQISKVNTIFFTLATYILCEEDLLFLLDYCKQNHIYVILLEKELINKNISNSVYTITDDFILK